jgi:hypothetical protein
VNPARVRTRFSQRFNLGLATPKLKVSVERAALIRAAVVNPDFVVSTPVFPEPTDGSPHPIRVALEDAWIVFQEVREV